MKTVEVSLMELITKAQKESATEPKLHKGLE